MASLSLRKSTRTSVSLGRSDHSFKRLIRALMSWLVQRGLIMYGPPGNGKTISLKTIMKTCGEQGVMPLYVKSFQSGFVVNLSNILL